MQLTNLSEIKALLARHGFVFSKSLGQNFIVNPGVCPHMAELCGAAKDVGVLEIGPGIGTLTRELAKLAGKVAAVEIDRRLPPILAETLTEFDNVRVIIGDAMEIDIAALLAAEFGDMPVVVCANLPYYITSPLLMRLLELRLPVRAITVMVQKEAAERICAAPGTRACGAVSVAISYYAEPQMLFSVSRGSFLPQPNVDSQVIRLTPRATPAVDVPDETAFFALVRAAFSQRRKTLSNALHNGLSIDKERIMRALSAAGLAPAVRAEELTLKDFARLTRELSAD